MYFHCGIYNVGRDSLNIHYSSLSFLIIYLRALRVFAVKKNLRCTIVTHIH